MVAGLGVPIFRVFTVGIVFQAFALSWATTLAA